MGEAILLLISNQPQETRMMDVDQWRRSIGLFSARRIGPRTLNGPPHWIHEINLLMALSLSCLLSQMAIAMAVIFTLLLLAGDVERNPGPRGKTGTLKQYD